MVRVKLPIIGVTYVIMDSMEIGHFLWLSRFGWHDCSASEDQFILMNLSYVIEVERV